MRTYLTGVLRMLSARGFRPSFNKGGVRKFKGEFYFKGRSVAVELSVSDWDFIEYPEIRIMPGQLSLPNIVSHQNHDGSLCYFSSDAVVLNRYDPVSAIDQCLNQAEALLVRCFDENFNHQEIVNEFPNYWIMRNISYGIINPNNGLKKLSFFGVIEPTAPISAIACADELQARQYFSVWLPDTTVKKVGHCFVLNTEKYPTLSTIKLPKTVKQFITWLSDWDRSLYQRFKAVVELDDDFLEYTKAVFSISYPGGTLGLSFDVDVHVSQKICAKNSKKIRIRNNKAYFQFLHGVGGAAKIDRFVLHDLSQDFIHQRNLQHVSLGGKKLLLIGCGTIGGHLADHLSALGAGTNSGALEVFDDDLLGIENIGRHVLGVKYLFEKKATALADYLKSKFPTSNISGYPNRITNRLDLAKYDLIIDATGNEPFGHMLNALRISSKASTPILHFWVKGNGECVQGIFCDDQSACLLCLRRFDINRFHEERFPALVNPPTIAYAACRSYTPYAITASVSAATLAAEMVVDWALGDPSPRFRTKARENSIVRKLKNQNLKPLDGCPACRS